jgi:DNA excision repair protein ERCC-1
MSSFKEAFESITKSRHYEPVPPPVPVQTVATTTTTQQAPSASASYSQRNPKSILVNPRQKGNPILKYVRSVPIEFSTDANMPADYVVSNTTVLLYLSIKYHKLNPQYLIGRMEACKRQYRLRVVLVQIDDVDCEQSMLRIQALCVANGFATICGFSDEECARYLELYKHSEKKSSEEIEEKRNADYVSRATDALTQIRGVNKSDVKNLLRNFGSIGAIMEAPMEDMALCAGIGEKKVTRMLTAFNEPFFSTTSQKSNSSNSVAAATTTTTVPDPIKIDMVTLVDAEDAVEGVDEDEEEDS